MTNLTVFNPAQVPAFAKTGELSETAKALLGGSLNTTKRISIKGGVFRLLSGGKEMGNIEDRHLDVVIVKAAPKVSRIFYARSYDAENIGGPDCFSNDGEHPDPSIKTPQHSACHNCPQNIAGSGQGNSRACRYQQRLAVVLENNQGGDVLQLLLPATSVFGKEEGDKRPLQAYVRHLASASPPVDVEKIVTRMKFDTKAESPKLLFAPVRWLEEDEYNITKEQGASREAALAVHMTASAPATPKDPVVPALAKPAPAKPAPKVAVVEDEEVTEPEVRKETTKASAVPAKKSKLADIVSDWDDE